MTYQGDSTLPKEILEQIATRGFDIVPELIQAIVNAAMEAEAAQQSLRAVPHQYSFEQQGRADRYKSKIARTRMGEIASNPSQIREGCFYPQALEKGLRSERALTLTFAEMYVQGVSTRKVKTIVERLCGASVSAPVVSSAAAQLDLDLESWRNRPLGEICYLFLDARYEKVRQHGRIGDLSILTAMGIDPRNRRQLLGVSVSIGGHELHWRTFLQSLVQRGLRNVRLITSDDHSGLRAARQAVFDDTPWQRCQLHLQQNATAYISRKEMLRDLETDIGMVFNAPDRQTADQYLKQIVQKYKKIAPRLSAWLVTNLPEGLSVFSFPAEHWRKLCTNNGLEQLNREIGRRTRGISIFPNDAACLRLISALLMEQDEKWQTGRAYLTCKTGLSSPSS